jgi:aquaporin Z
MLMKKLGAEFIGTFMLVSAVFAAGALGLISGSYLHVPLTIGVSVMVMAYAVGHISGGHFNPAVTCGLVAAGRHPASEAVPYIVAQVLGACAAGLFWYSIGTLAAHDPTKAIDLGNFASNGYDSPGHYSLGAAALAEVVATAIFLFVIVGATSKAAPAGFAPLAIGLCLFAVIIMTIPVSNGSINPARSTGTAIVGGTVALQQLWLFWVAPIVGGIIGGLRAERGLTARRTQVAQRWQFTVAPQSAGNDSPRVTPSHCFDRKAL